MEKFIGGIVMKKKRSLVNDILILAVIAVVLFGVLQIKKIVEPVDYSKTLKIVDEKPSFIAFDRFQIVKNQATDLNGHAYVLPYQSQDNILFGMEGSFDTFDNDGEEVIRDYKKSTIRINMDTQETVELFSLGQDTLQNFIHEIDGEIYYSLSEFETVAIDPDEPLSEHFNYRLVESNLYKINKSGISEKIDLNIPQGYDITLENVIYAGNTDSSLYLLNYSNYRPTRQDRFFQILALKENDLRVVHETRCTIKDEEDHFVSLSECAGDSSIEVSNLIFMDDEHIMTEITQEGSKVNFYKEDVLTNTINLERKIKDLHCDKETESFIYSSNGTFQPKDKIYRYDINQNKEFELQDIPYSDEVQSRYIGGKIYYYEMNGDYISIYDIKKNTYYTKAIGLGDNYTLTISVHDKNIYIAYLKNDFVEYRVYTINN